VPKWCSATARPEKTRKTCGFAHSGLAFSGAFEQFAAVLEAGDSKW
jgi:hypothetical protein